MRESTDSSRTTTPGKPRFELLSLAYFSLQQQREVGAAPHRGNANRPLTKQGKAPKPEQGKAKTLRTLTNKRRAGNKKINC
jgi:hypothetical protein